MLSSKVIQETGIHIAHELDYMFGNIHPSTGIFEYEVRKMANNDSVISYDDVNESVFVALVIIASHEFYNTRIQKSLEGVWLMGGMVK